MEKRYSIEKMGIQKKMIVVASLTIRLIELKMRKEVFQDSNETRRRDTYILVHGAVIMQPLAHTIVCELKHLLGYQGEVVLDKDLESMIALAGSCVRAMNAANRKADIELSGRPKIKDSHFRHLFKGFKDKFAHREVVNMRGRIGYINI